MSDLTRRDFVKTATVTAAGATALTTLPAWAVQENRDPVKIGLIGCGGRGTGAANQSLTATESSVIWAMGDAFPDRLNTSAKTLISEKGDRAKVPSTAIGFSQKTCFLALTAAARCCGRK